MCENWPAARTADPCPWALALCCSSTAPFLDRGVRVCTGLKSAYEYGIPYRRNTATVDYGLLSRVIRRLFVRGVG